MQQDAHEFLNYLLNDIAETLVKEKKLPGRPRGAEEHAASPPAGRSSGQPRPAPPATWVHELFQGVLTNETKCLCCETAREAAAPALWARRRSLVGAARSPTAQRPSSTCPWTLSRTRP